MIICKDVRLTYRKKNILNGADFEAEAGKITVLLGRNGCGKTSLLRCIAGARHHSKGEILLNGKDNKKLSPAERGKILSVMVQNLPSPPVSVRELASFGRQPYLAYGGRPGENDRIKIQKAMELTGILSHERDMVNKLSGGERQLAFFTMLLVQDTPIVLLDEPTSNLDAEYRRRVYDTMKKMRDGGKTVVATLHCLEDAVMLADKIYVMDKGKTVFKGSAKEFSESEIPESIFGLKPLKVKSEDNRELTVFLMK